MRWWKEFRDPSLKCARVGHTERKRYRTGYVRPKDWGRYICEKVTQEAPCCRRCGLLLGEFQDVGSRQGFTGYSWPSYQAAEFRENGAFWETEGWA